MLASTILDTTTGVNRIAVIFSVQMRPDHKGDNLRAARRWIVACVSDRTKSAALFRKIPLRDETTLEYLQNYGRGFIVTGIGLPHGGKDLPAEMHRSTSKVFYLPWNLSGKML